MPDRPFKCRSCKRSLPLAVLYLIESNMTAIAVDRIAIDGMPATFCPYCGARIETTVDRSSMEYPIETKGTVPDIEKVRVSHNSPL